MKQQMIHIEFSSSLGTRQQNQDNFYYPGRKVSVLKRRDIYDSRSFRLRPRKKKGLLFAVADGMGGESSGELAAKTLLSGLSTIKSADDKSLFEINDRVVALASGQTAGTTLVCIEIRSDGKSCIGYITAAGDSPCYLIRGNTVTKLTHDENLYQAMIDNGEMIPEEEMSKKRAKAGLLNFFGKSDLHLQKKIVVLQPGDTLLLCSDGVAFDETSDPFVLETGCSDLVQQSVETNIVNHHYSDNTTAMILRYEEVE